MSQDSEAATRFPSIGRGILVRPPHPLWLRCTTGLRQPSEGLLIRVAPEVITLLHRVLAWMGTNSAQLFPLRMATSSFGSVPCMPGPSCVCWVPEVRLCPSSFGESARKHRPFEERHARLRLLKLPLLLRPFSTLSFFQGAL